MEDSLKGILITATVILIFITCILNFIVLFPQEQGVTFSSSGQQGYLTMANNTDTGVNRSLNTLSNSSSNALNNWDVTQGFMGSNTMKQGQLGVASSITQVFSSLKIISTQVFGLNSPILWVLGILSTLAGIVIIYAIYQFVRTGR